MTKPHPFLTLPRHLWLWLWLFSLSMPVMAITWTNQQPADLVLGQASFTTRANGTANNALNNGPAGMAVDPTTSKVFIADINNHRVLRYASLNSLTNGATAEAVLGTTGTAGCSPNTFRNPSVVTIDSSGHLWVSDHNNSRILRFDNAATIASGANASAVLGQPNFTTCPNPGPVTQNGIDRPCGLTIDSGGHLWVTICYSNRVLRFDNAASKANGANADGVLGQPNFTSSVAGLSATTMNVPTAVTIDAAGNLYVMDANNRRVLRFNSATSKANGAAADLVLGQPNFTSNGAATTQTGMDPNWNGGVAVDNSTGQVFVGDTQNHRVLIYSNPTTNGIAASYVLGQPNFTSAIANNGGISAFSLNGPRGLFFDPTTTSLLVADMWNNRILRYTNPEIQVLDGATDLPLNSTLNVGTTNVGIPTYKILTVKAVGNGNLNLTGSPIVSVTGTGFAAATSPAASIAPANPSTFILQFNPGTVGNFTGSLSMVNNDSDENPFVLSLQGTAVSTVGSPVLVDRIDSDDTGSFAACTATANDCSLRGAVAAVTSGGVINFDPSIAGQTITLSSTININKSLTIDGTGQKISISGNNAVRVFLVINGASTTLRALTISNGNISNGNAGAASGGGGIFYNGGSTTGDVIDKCTLMGNQADWGGAIYHNSGASAKLTLTNSTLVNNQATGPNGGRGGAFRSENAWGEITNTTIANNQATVDGGGISTYFPMNLAIKNTIVALNTVNGNPNDVVWETYGFPVTNSLFTTNPLFGPLQNNGGDTQTMALLTGSPAIDTGNAASCQATDQRGVARPFDGNTDGSALCDMGAYEVSVSTLTLATTGTGQGTVSSSGTPAGTSCGTDCLAYQSGTAVTLTPTATSGVFTGWNCTPTFTSGSALLANTTCTATFTFNPIYYNLTLATMGGGTGTVSSSGSPAGTSCGANCLTYFSTTPVTLTATATNNSTFAGWNCTPAFTSGNVLTANTSCTATFNAVIPIAHYHLSVLTDGTGTGTVAGAGSYPAGTTITLEATPDPGSIFAGWSGGCSNTMTLTADMTCTATFEVVPPRILHISFAGTGQGQLSGGLASDSTGINCSSTTPTCSYTVFGTQWVYPKFIPATGSELAGWSGDPACTKDGPGKILLLQDTTCIVTVNLKLYTLSVGRNVPGVTLTSDGLNCQDTPQGFRNLAGAAEVTTCQATYPYGTTVKLTASSAPLEWEWVGWKGSCDNQGQVVITQDRLCQAQYREDPNVPNGIDGNGDGENDAHQLHVMSLADKVAGNYITLVVNPECVVADSSTVLADSLDGHDPNHPAPQGLMYFELKCSQTPVTMYFHGVNRIPRNIELLKYGPTTPGDANTVGWYKLPNVQFGLATVGGKPVATVTYTLTDGQLGDSTGVDGKIVDPAGLGVK